MTINEAIHKLTADSRDALRELSRAKNAYAAARQAIIDANEHAASLIEPLREAERRATPLKEQAKTLRHMAEGLCAETMRVGSDTWHMTDKECPRKTKVHCDKCNASFCGIHGGTSANGYPKHNCDRVKTFTFQLGIGAPR